MPDFSNYLKYLLSDSSVLIFIFCLFVFMVFISLAEKKRSSQKNISENAPQAHDEFIKNQGENRMAAGGDLVYVGEEEVEFEQINFRLDKRKKVPLFLRKSMFIILLLWLSLICYILWFEVLVSTDLGIVVFLLLTSVYIGLIIKGAKVFLKKNSL